MFFQEVLRADHVHMRRKDIIDDFIIDILAQQPFLHTALQEITGTLRGSGSPLFHKSQNFRISRNVKYELR